MNKYRQNDDPAKMGMAVAMSKEFEVKEDTKEDLAMLAKIFSSFDHDVGEKSTYNISSWGEPSVVGPTKSKGMTKPGKKYLPENFYLQI